MLNKIRTKHGKYLIIIFSYIVISFLSVLFLVLSKHLFNTSDMPFHIRRIMELTNSISHFNFLPGISFNFIHGSSLMSMYPYLSIYPFSLLLLVTHSFMLSYYVYFSLVIFSSLVICFFASKSYSRSISISYIFSITYSMSIEYVLTAFTSGDLGILSSLVVLPLVIFGFISLMKTNNEYLELITGLSLLLFCQIPTFLIALGFIIIWAIINIKRFSKNLIKTLIKSIILLLLLTSVVWVPFIRVYIYNNISTVRLQQLSGCSISDFFKSLSIFSVIGIILFLLFYKKLCYYTKQMYLLSILIILLSSKIFPWKFVTSYSFLRFLNQFQFTSRFLIIPQILLSYIFAVCVNNIFRRIHKRGYLYRSGLIVIIIIFQFLGQGYVLYKQKNVHSEYINSSRDAKIADRLGTFSITPKTKNSYLLSLVNNGYYTKDYYPKALNNENRNINRINSSKGFIGNINISFKHIGYNTFSFMTTKDIKRLYLPFLYYKGTKINLYLNHKLTKYSINKGIILINNIHKGKNIVYIKYIPNVYVLLIEYSMLIFGVLWIIFYALHYMN